MRTNLAYSNRKHLDYYRICGKCPTKEKFTNANLDQSNNMEFSIARAIKSRRYKIDVIPVTLAPIIPIRNKF